MDDIEKTRESIIHILEDEGCCVDELLEQAGRSLCDMLTSSKISINDALTQSFIDDIMELEIE